MKIGICHTGEVKYEQITPSHLFKSVNRTYIILTLDTAYQTKENHASSTLVWQEFDV